MGSIAGLRDAAPDGDHVRWTPGDERKRCVVDRDDWLGHRLDPGRAVVVVARERSAARARAADEIVGRAKGLIITGGLNVYPKEIEERIDAMDGVVESAVVGVPDMICAATMISSAPVRLMNAWTRAAALKRAEGSLD